MRHLSPFIIAVCLSLASAACGDKTVRPAAGEAKKPPAAREAVKAPAPVAKKSTGKDRGALARAFALSRCVMIGVLSEDPKYYTDNGFADDAAFRLAFQAEAQVDVIWARSVVAKATHAPCAGLDGSVKVTTNGSAEKKP